ncbi:MAG: hypothetical protein IPI46_06995 [Bacteroidetes bacterium]|nr:hypothetical protein [Bacteroidota bacterium]
MALGFFIFTSSLNAHPQRRAHARHHHVNRGSRHEGLHQRGFQSPRFGFHAGHCGPRSRQMGRHNHGRSCRHRSHR